jgi:glyoxylase-like metal-dependent hydrolase (beta-lactamase superfamily II)
MKTTELSANALQLTRYGFVNCYLVRESDGFTLIDTGLSGSEKDILGAASAAGGAVRRIVLTHAHVDHVGSVDALMSALPDGTLLAASERSLPLLRKPPNLLLAAAEPQGKIKGGVPGIASVPNHLLAAGELFGSLRVLATPGHIPGHISLLDERDGTLYAGDAVVTMGRISISGSAPWYFPLPNFATWNKQLAVESVRHLVPLPIERIAAGHGAVRQVNRQALETVIRKAGG